MGQKRNPTDVRIARRIQLARFQANMSEQVLAKTADITATELRSYEAGTRIEPDALYAIARALDLHIGFFYEGIWSLPEMLK